MLRCWSREEGREQVEMPYVDVGYRAKLPLLRLGDDRLVLLSHAQVVMENQRG